MSSQLQQPKDEYDLVVVGSGVGGMATALAALEAGMSVAMLEKDHWIGGGTALSHGGLWAGCNHIARRAGIPDSREAVIEYMRFVAGGEADNELLMAYVDSAPVALEYFERCGVGIRLLPGFPDHYFPVAPGSTEVGRSLESVPVSLRDLGELGDRIENSEIDPHRASVSEFISWGGIVNRKNRDHALVTKREQDKVRTCGAALIAHFLKGLLRHNTTPFLETAAEELLERNGAITGILTNTGRQVKGRYGVVLAAGGYEGDAEMTRSFEGLPGWHSPFPKAIAGDAFRLATEVGAASAFTRNNLAVMVGVPVPSKVKGHEPEFRLVQIFECQMPHTIIVNAQGKRFSDEAYFQDTIAALRHYDVWKREYPNLPCYMLFDSQYVENFAFCGNDIGTPPPEWVTQADTLEELAGLLGISKSGLLATVAEFNSNARDGVDRAFHRGEKKWTQAKSQEIRGIGTPNPALGPLDKAPYFGVQLFPAAFVPSGGIRTNSNGQVLSIRGKPIPNLFAVGNSAAHLEYGIGYQAGYSLTAAMTFAYRCVEHLKH